VRERVGRAALQISRFVQGFAVSAAGMGGRKMFHVKHLCDLFAVKFFAREATMR
jgi:hypothetical protein